MRLEVARAILIPIQDIRPTEILYSLAYYMSFTYVS